MENSIILGLNTKDVFDPSDPPITSERYQGRVYTPNPADIYGGFYTLFVYTDIIEHQVAGDHFVPLLRCVHISGEDKDVVTISYDKVHYVQYECLNHRCQTPVLEGRCVCWFSGCSQHPWFIQVIDWLKNGHTLVCRP